MTKNVKFGWDVRMGERWWAKHNMWRQSGDVKRDIWGEKEYGDEEVDDEE
ncbi:hypothetical protein FACS189472_18930 [Alphaproteobacteria bacterium]|nr:hypothetical protein FACS189472_18930 [Alphaproteobacteria bacterium]